MSASRILCLAAHPDDLEVYMGGALLLFREEKALVRAVQLTEGERATRQTAAGSRRAEAMEAFAILGIEGRFLDLGDGRLADVDLDRVLAAEMEAFEPDLVFGPHTSDAHPDHVAIGRALDRLDEGGPGFFWRYLDAGPQAEPTHLLDLGDDYRPKEELIRVHASQIPAPGESKEHLPDGLDILERAYQRDRRYGERAGCRFAEPYVGPGPEGGGAVKLARELADFIGG